MTIFQRMRWSSRAGWVALAVAALCAAILVALVLSRALDKDAGPWAKLFLLILGILGAAAGLGAAGEIRSKRGQRGHQFLKPQPIAILFLAIFGGFAVMSDAVALFQPPPAAESKRLNLERGIDTLLGRTEPAPDPQATLRSHLAGFWGEPGCAVVFRFRLNVDALVADAIKRPPGKEPYRLVARITGGRGNVLETRGIAPASARGMAATFTYSRDGAGEALTWDDQRTAPVEYERCG